MSQSPGDPETLAEGTLISHLLELRTRLLRSVVAVAICFIPLAFFSNELFTLVAHPLIERLPEGTSIIATSVVSPFMTPLKLPLFASSVVLFYVGVAFAYFVVFPLMFTFLTATAPEGVRMMTDMASYLDFTLLLFFAFGLAFEMPVATVLLVTTGLVKVETLRKNRGYVVLGIFVVAAFLTPPDAISQTFMAVPMYVLYEFGILLSQFLGKRRAADKARHEAAQSGE